MSDEKPVEKKKRKATKPWNTNVLHIPGVTDNEKLKSVKRLRFCSTKNLEENKPAGYDENGAPIYYEPLRSSAKGNGITGRDGTSVDSVIRVRQDLVACSIPEDLAQALDEDKRERIVARKQAGADIARQQARASGINLRGGAK